MSDTNHIGPEDKAAFERDGYHLIRPLFSVEEAAAWRDRINAVFQLPAAPDAAKAIAGATHTLADGVTITEDFWPIIFNERLVAAVRSLIGNDIRYTQHSDLHINLPGGRWHRDSACRDFGVGDDWDETDAPYRVVRVAIYLSDHAASNSSLVVLPGSHRQESRVARTEYVMWNRLRSFLRRHGKNDLLSHHFLSAKRKVLETRPGDCVIFDQRLMHAGGVIRGPEPKYAIYLSYGVDNQHSRNHRAFFLNRPTYSPDLPGALRTRLSVAGLLLDDTPETIQT
jgi:ectoine hydroxylase